MTPTPIQLDPNHQFNSISDSTLEQAQLNAQFAYEAQIADWNRARAAEYEAAWKVYVAARDARPDSPSNVPAPVPARAEAVYRDSRGWPYVDTSDKPVVAPHTYVPAVKTPGASIFGTASILGSADSLLINAPLYKPFTYGLMTFQRLA